ncbi:hypothetical protein E1091_06300 [Micromonospora fluostatini]|uniref:Integral membrane protein n=1 Tax=Micromonospora fluostatini TaxID=1629071 RepID=A0ABY2DIW7_9ACTN|nr:hypothetical protein E1091_06300 [Micromonospora fluostatini]
MTTGSGLDDDERRRTAERTRQRHTWLVVLLVALVLVGAVPVLVGAYVGEFGRQPARVATVLLVALVPAMIGAAVLVALRRGRWRDLSRTTGADRATGRRVLQALREGGSDDPRIDALARDEAARQVRTRWLTWVFPVVAVNGANMLVTGTTTVVRVLGGLNVATMLVLTLASHRTVRRARRYLASPVRHPVAPGRRDGMTGAPGGYASTRDDDGE